MTTFISFGNLDKKFPSMVDSIILAEGIIPTPVVIQAGANIDSFLHYSENSNYIVFDFCSNDDYINYVRNSSLIITHAGVGAINTALSFWKKPIIFARRSIYNEHVNDHQLEFSEKFKFDNIFFLVNNLKDLLLSINLWRLDKIPSRNEIICTDKLADDLKNYILSIIKEK